jgi:hypothetical protein
VVANRLIANGCQAWTLGLLIVALNLILFVAGVQVYTPYCGPDNPTPPPVKPAPSTYIPEPPAPVAPSSYGTEPPTPVAPATDAHGH